MKGCGGIMSRSGSKKLSKREMKQKYLFDPELTAITMRFLERAIASRPFVGERYGPQVKKRKR